MKMFLKRTCCSFFGGVFLAAGLMAWIEPALLKSGWRLDGAAIKAAQIDYPGHDGCVRQPDRCINY
jgi:hypothetical protein